MTTYDTTDCEGTDTDHGDGLDLKPRDVRTLTELLLVYEHAPGVFHVYSERGTEYGIDAETGACMCPDAEYRQPDGGCKHARRVAYRDGVRAIPEWVNRDALDPLLDARLDELEDTAVDGDVDADENLDEDGRDNDDMAAARTVATDGGQTASPEMERGEIDEVPGYTEHVEPRSQGGETYVRCEACGRELLVSLGGRDRLRHVSGCSNARDSERVGV